MKIKLFFTALFLLLSKCNAYCQEVAGLNIPAGWTTEKFALPPAFASGIPVKGTEEIAFSPQWSKKKTEGYWTYCYLWTLDGFSNLNKTGLERALTTYYTRLVITNLTLANIDSAYAIPVKVHLHQLQDNHNFYQGTIKMLDYMTQDPMVLNISIHIKGTNLVFFQLSPLPYANKFWATMKEIEPVKNP